MRAWILALLPSVVLAKGPTIEYFELEHRTPAELAKALEPLLSDEGAVQTYNQTLIVKEHEAQLKTIRELIQHLDQEPVQLKVSVSFGRSKPNATLNNEQSFTKRNFQTQRERDRKVHHLQMISGQTAFMAQGESIPVVLDDYAYDTNATRQFTGTTQATNQSGQISATLPAQAGTQINVPPNQSPLTPITPSHSLVAVTPVTNALIQVPAAGGNITVDLNQSQGQSNTTQSLTGQLRDRGTGRYREHIELQSGVYLNPTWLGEKVRLHIRVLEQSAHRFAKFQAAKNQPAYSHHQSETTVEVPLEKWVYVGGNQTEMHLKQSWDHSTQNKKDERHQIWVKIEKVSTSTQ